MGRYCGKIGFVVNEKTAPGVYKPKTSERVYRGEILTNFMRVENNPNSTNDNVVINNKFSIVADAFAFENFHHIRYIEYMGTKWKVTNVEPLRPRIILTAGGVYNG